ncbi:MAG: peptidoglycan-associated lipoprotein Pal [Woeseiaceae bacterium]|nr:peptidoglycan-associated lipoprotein Pal [Woeseiaceae bacterium]
MKYDKLLAIGVLALLIGACGGGQTIPDPEPTSEVGGGMDRDSSAGSSGWETEGLGEGESFEEDRMDGELGMIVYFGFDESELQAEYTDMLAAHANRLANNSRLSIRLEGHADERGSREYNIGLGERRAQAVRRTLLLQGASANQISTVSFGEERPAAFGSDEESYALNRRVEINYLN